MGREEYYREYRERLKEIGNLTKMYLRIGEGELARKSMEEHYKLVFEHCLESCLIINHLGSMARNSNNPELKKSFLKHRNSLAESTEINIQILKQLEELIDNPE